MAPSSVSHSQPIVTPGRTLLLVSNALYGVGGFMADFSDSHILNPRWPPHAKFHNGQTMTLALFLSLSSLYYLYRPTSSAAQARDSVTVSALIAAMYCAAGLAAIWYPGTAWLDPEFESGSWVEDRRQLWLFSGVVAGCWGGWWLETKRLREGEGKGKGL
ncbi:hypothetical protein LTS18_005608 [Coniosporium uncinatum]|uniref:Uncharacterized protein n=1 Tax=Coniosporium uncinatum TaxID=93489 RepID=A0ACC3DRJ1_9PEZI|nr:hypothetical protein LTS18_005608 [Coniosporium uncinatum]